MYELFPSRGRNTTTDLIADLLAVAGSSHEVALEMIVFLRHFCPKGRSQQVSESSSFTSRLRCGLLLGNVAKDSENL